MLFQQQAIVNLQNMLVAKSHTKSSENFLYLLLSNTYLIWLLTAVDSKCNTNLEIYNTNVV